MLRAHIDVAMDGPRDRNIFGAFALMISDDIVRASSSRAPEAGPAASALALLAHKPGLSIRMLAIGVGLSHAGTVRLVDRLVSEGLIERREHSTDGRARSLYLTPTGKVASDEVLASRDQVIAEGLSILNPDELKPYRTSLNAFSEIAWKTSSSHTASAACAATRAARTAPSMPNCMSEVWTARRTTTRRRLAIAAAQRCSDGGAS